MTTPSPFPEFAAPLDACNLPPQRRQGGNGPRILIARTKANGDILMGTPLLAALRHQYPDAHLTWMVERREKEAIDANPYVDELLLWDTKFWKNMTRRGLFPLYFWHLHQLKQLLKTRHYDVLISFEPEDWPFLPQASGAKQTIGVFDTFREYHQQTRTSNRARLYDHVFTYGGLPPHRTDQYLLPLSVLGYDGPPPSKRMTMGYTNRDETAVSAFLRENHVAPSDRVVVIAPLTGWPSRCWPGERYAALADALLAQHGREGLRVVLIGSGKDSEKSALHTIAAQMKAEVPPIIAAGTLSFRQMAALIARAALVVGGDSGPMHVAAAVDTPYVALFGPSPVERFAPLMGRGLPLAHPVPCGPCHQFRCPNKTPKTHQICLRLLTVEEVLAAAQSFLNTNDAPRSTSPSFECAVSLAGSGL